jgi:osmoprotectant transport system ATP-binding protein
VISLQGVSKRFADGTVAVDDLDLEIPGGEITILLGPSGCGKTTTLRMINRLIEPSQGTILLGGQDVMGLPATELRRGIGYVIQHAGLFPHRTVAENVATVPRLLGADKRQARARALELLQLVGLDAAMADRYPRQLSGGQQQRVGVARALAADPPVLLMDEPFGAVDPIFRATLQREFLRLQRELRKTVVFVTHDVDEAVLLGDRIAIFRQGGTLAQFDTPAEMLARPADEYVADFLGATRGLKLLSLRSAADVPFLPGGKRADGWALELQERRPVAWIRDGRRIAVDGVGPDRSVRDLLDAAVVSPVGSAVRVDEAGAFLGLVPFASLEGHLEKRA